MLSLAWNLIASYVLDTVLKSLYVILSTELILLILLKKRRLLSLKDLNLNSSVEILSVKILFCSGLSIS